MKKRPESHDPACVYVHAGGLVSAAIALTLALTACTGERSPDRETLERYALGRSLYLRQSLEEALSLLLENDRKAPRFSGNSFLIGKILLLSDDHRGAEQYWRQTLRHNPRHIDTGKWLARLYLMDSRTDEAEQLVTRALADSSEDPELFILLGKAHRSRGDIAGAIECFTKAKLHAERLVEAPLELAGIYRSLGMPGRSRIELERALSLAGKESALYPAIVAGLEALPEDASR